jgi:hypothetical protein
MKNKNPEKNGSFEERFLLKTFFWKNFLSFQRKFHSLHGPEDQMKMFALDMPNDDSYTLFCVLFICDTWHWQLCLYFRWSGGTLLWQTNAARNHQF